MGNINKAKKLMFIGYLIAIFSPIISVIGFYLSYFGSFAIPLISLFLGMAIAIILQTKEDQIIKKMGNKLVVINCLSFICCYLLIFLAALSNHELMDNFLKVQLKKDLEKNPIIKQKLVYSIGDCYKAQLNDSYNKYDLKIQTFESSVTRDAIKLIKLENVFIYQDDQLIPKDEYSMFYTSSEFVLLEGEFIIKMEILCKEKKCVDKADPISFKIVIEGFEKPIEVVNKCKI